MILSRGTHKTKPGGQAERERNSATVCESTGTQRSISTGISAGQAPRHGRSSSIVVLSLMLGDLPALLPTIPEAVHERVADNIVDLVAAALSTSSPPRSCPSTKERRCRLG
jgi:hypothetical protein